MGRIFSIAIENPVSGAFSSLPSRRTVASGIQFRSYNWRNREFTHHHESSATKITCVIVNFQIRDSGAFIISQPASNPEIQRLAEDNMPATVTDARDASGSKAVEVRLPTPQEAPEADWVIYDGKCVFCKRQVATLHRFDGSNRLAFVSLHDPRVAERCPDLTFEMLMDQMYVVTQDDRRYGGADAVRYLTRRLPRLWFAAPLLHFPFSMPLWRMLYRYIANRRYKIAGKTDDCEGGTCDLHFKK